MGRNVDNTIRVPGPTDGALLRIAAAYLSDVPTGRVTLSYAPHLNQEVGADMIAQIIDGYERPNERRIYRVQFNVQEHGQAVMYFERSILTPNGQGGVVPVPSAFEAEFVLEHMHFVGAQAKAIMSAIWDNLGVPVGYSDVGHPQLVDVFTRQAHTLSEQTLANNADLTKARRVMEAELLKQKSKQAAELQRERDAFQGEVSARLAQLDEEKTQLDAKMKDVDDRRARHARREHRQNITAQIQDRLRRPAASPEVRRHRLYVFSIAYAGFFIAVASAGWAAFELAGDTAATITPKLFIDAGRFFASTLLATVLLFYGLGHWRRVEREDAEYVRDMERFGLDIDRASWIVETVMEFREEKVPGDVPDAWMLGASANLFNSRPQLKEEEPNALEALGELLKKGARIQVGPTGAELEVSGKAAQKVGKSGS